MELQTNPHNPRTISKDAYEKLKRSIERNPDGLTANKIAHKDGIIISGNQRYRAILELGLTIKPEWLKDLSGWTQEQIDEWVIQSNISAGEWDWDILANEWEADNLIDWGIDMPDDWGETKELPEDIDEIPEVKTPVSKLGDLWLLNGHRVLCGDSTDKTTVERLMDGKKADMVFTDPPYGIEFQSNFRKKTPQFAKIQNDEITLDITEPLEQTMSDNCVAYICTRWDLYPQWFQQIQQILQIKNCIVWYKRGGGLGDLEHSYSPNHEFIIVGHKGKNPLQGKRDADVWEITRDGFNDYEHPTQKPIALPAFAIEHHSKQNDLILDLFLGSGSTLIACEQTNRICYGIELDPLYVDVICKRWQTLTGQMPILESTGETHDFINNIK